MPSGVAQCGGAAWSGAGCGSAPERPNDIASEVGALLAKLGLSQYLPKFSETGVNTVAAVRMMTEADMIKQCGMTAEHAQHLLRVVRGELNGVASLPAGAPTAQAATPQPGQMPLAALPLGGGNVSALTAPAAGGQFCQTAAPLQPQALPAPDTALQSQPTGQELALAHLQLAQALSLQAQGDSGVVAGVDPAALPALLGESAASGAQLDLLALQQAMAAAAQAGQADPAAQQSIVGAAGATGAAGVVYNQLYALAQCAEESAQMNASAAAFCATPLADPLQITAVSEAAQQAAQRAAWAVSTMNAFKDQVALGPDGGDTGWIFSMMQVAQQASDAADQAAQSCKLHATAVEGQLEGIMPRKSKVPCKNVLAGRCLKGLACEFSHDPADREARPLMLKSLKPCIFFAKGNCTRGPACPFAHGEEERQEIEKIVDSMRKQKRMLGKGSTRY